MPSEEIAMLPLPLAVLQVSADQSLPPTLASQTLCPSSPAHSLTIAAPSYLHTPSRPKCICPLILPLQPIPYPGLTHHCCTLSLRMALLTSAWYSRSAATSSFL